MRLNYEILKPVYCDQKSFYYKAKIMTKDPAGKKSNVLYSYDTFICDLTDLKKVIFGCFTVSNTTLRHLKDFLMQNDIDCVELTHENKARNFKQFIQQVQGEVLDLTPYVI